MLSIQFIHIFTALLQTAEISKIHAEEKDEEVTILEHSVEELESTITVLEDEVNCSFISSIVFTVLIIDSSRCCIRTAMVARKVSE